MGEVITFPDVEALLVTALNAALTEPVSTRVPNPRPSAFVRLYRSGGVRRALTIDDATVVVEAWADTEPAAAALAQTARAHLHATDALGAYTVLRTGEYAAPANLPDPVSGQARYTATYQVLVGS